jgi:hypothetical protein
MSQNPIHHALPPEQQRYALWLAWCTRAGLAVLVISFLLYVGGVIVPLVELARLPEFWKLSAADYQRATGSPTGWGWLDHLHRGDYASLLGIAVLAAASLFCLLAVMPIYAQRRERIYLAVCALEIGVLALAASGILTGGH